jgi:regulator of nucleoside diphosphate kinase
MQTSTFLLPNGHAATEPYDRFRRESASDDPEQLNMVQEELDRAQIVSPSGIPGDVVTMHSRVLVRDLNANQDFTYTLVFPSMRTSPEERSRFWRLWARRSADVALAM